MIYVLNVIVCNFTTRYFLYAFRSIIDFNVYKWKYLPLMAFFQFGCVELINVILNHERGAFWSWIHCWLAGWLAMAAWHTITFYKTFYLEHELLHLCQTHLYISTDVICSETIKINCNIKNSQIGYSVSNGENDCSNIPWVFLDALGLHVWKTSRFILFIDCAFS